MAGQPLLTYDTNPAVVGLALEHRLDARSVTVYTAQLQYKTELLIGRDLSWLTVADHAIRATTKRRIRRRPVASDSTVNLPPSMAADVPRGYVPVAHAAAELGVTRRTVERMAASGQLERQRAGGAAYISEPSLRAALAKRASREPVPTRAELTAVLAGIEKLLGELREDRRALMQAMAEREEARLQVMELQEELRSLRGGMVSARAA